MSCAGHEPGYEHLEHVEAIWDVGLKLILMRPLRPAGPPYLVASCSFRTPAGERKYLPFALPAASWRSEAEPVEADLDELLERALPRLEALLEEMKTRSSYPEPEHPIWV